MINEYGMEEGIISYSSACTPINLATGRLIGLTGFAQTGKDTVGNYLVNKFGFRRLAFADALRVALYNLNPIVAIQLDPEKQTFSEKMRGDMRIVQTTLRVKDLVDEYGWDYVKVNYPEVRNLLQRLGTEAGRDIHGQDCWTNIIAKEINANPTQDFVITDVRFPNEVDTIERLGGTILKIEREGVGSVNGHISDKGIDNVLHVLHNNGSLEELHNKVEEFLKNPENLIDKPTPCLV